jgi:Protein of unknown function (DUF3761)
MRNQILPAILLLGLLLPAGASHGQITNTITATCEDGSTFSGTKRTGACRGHGGVQSWGAAPAAASPAATTSEPGPARQSTRAAPPGNGQVWVNTASKVYHCPGTRWYGKTKKGEYMSETQARAEGVRPDHGKACGS